MAENITILLVDDDLDERELFQTAIYGLSTNFKLVTLNDGVYLMDYLVSKPDKRPHIIFLDINMPRKNGLECLIEIRNNPHLRDIPIAMYTTSNNENDIQSSFTLGANVYIKKPDVFNDLKRLIKQTIETDWENRQTNEDNFLMK